MKAALKALRASQPFNFVATTTVRALLRATGLQSELVIRHLHRMGEVTTELPNGRTMKLWSRGDDWVSNQLFWRGWSGYEPETTGLFYRLACQSRTTVDVGAYVGYFTLLAGLANPNGRVVAFEPHPSIYERLRKNVDRNGLDHCTCVQAAVGASASTAEFYLGTDYGLPTSSSLSFEFMRGTPGMAQTTVKVLTLDQFARDNRWGPIDLLKIDTEATEPDVLVGAAERLSADHPDIVCEVLAGRADERRLESILAPLGYRFYLLTPDGPSRRDHIEGHPDWLNYLFTARPATEALLARRPPTG